MAAIVITAVTAAKSSAIRFRARFVDCELASTGIFAIELSDSPVSFVIARHFDKTKAT